MSDLRLEHLGKSFGEFRAVDDVSLSVAEGELLVLLGPSGCGKTTTLRMIAGFIEATTGRILLGGRDVTYLPPYRRNTGLVFQGYALFPHLSVFENVAFGLEMRRLDRTTIKAKVADALRLVRLEALGQRMPRQLSGGQQQRVALARALVIAPDILLLDEPLSNLDAKLRQEVRVEIRELQKKLGLTAVMVTHDQEEALSMADRLVVMNEGRVQQIGTQRELYNHPQNRFVANFIGRTNFFEGAVTAPGRFRSAGGLDIAFAAGAAERRLLAVRPEKIRLGREASPNCFPGVVERVTYLGSQTEYQVRLASGEAVAIHAQNAQNGADEPLAPGLPVHVAWDAESCQLLD
ncbi:MAG TPA: ABC transporter ATP-binding protein [Stellaceae bacterium]|nr:ABC transporter ATP-binding protein [Stellaceae bacterium]